MIPYLYLILRFSAAVLFVSSQRARLFDCFYSPEAAIDCNIHVSKVIITVELGYILYQHFIRDCAYKLISLERRFILSYENVVQFCKLRKNILYKYLKVKRSNIYIIKSCL